MDEDFYKTVGGLIETVYVDCSGSDDLPESMTNLKNIVQAIYNGKSYRIIKKHLNTLSYNQRLYLGSDFIDQLHEACSITNDHHRGTLTKIIVYALNKKYDKAASFLTYFAAINKNKIFYYSIINDCVDTFTRLFGQKSRYLTNSTIFELAFSYGSRKIAEILMKQSFAQFYRPDKITFSHIYKILKPSILFGSLAMIKYIVEEIIKKRTFAFFDPNNGKRAALHNVVQQAIPRGDIEIYEYIKANIEVICDIPLEPLQKIMIAPSKLGTISDLIACPSIDLIKHITTSADYDNTQTSLTDAIGRHVIVYPDSVEYLLNNNLLDNSTLNAFKLFDYALSEPTGKLFKLLYYHEKFANFVYVPSFPTSTYQIKPLNNGTMALLKECFNKITLELICEYIPYYQTAQVFMHSITCSHPNHCLSYCLICRLIGYIYFNVQQYPVDVAEVLFKKIEPFLECDKNIYSQLFRAYHYVPEYTDLLISYKKHIDVVKQYEPFGYNTGVRYNFYYGRVEFNINDKTSLDTLIKILENFKITNLSMISNVVAKLISTYRDDAVNSQRLLELLIKINYNMSSIPFIDCNINIARYIIKQKHDSGCNSSDMQKILHTRNYEISRYTYILLYGEESCDNYMFNVMKYPRLT